MYKIEILSSADKNLRRINSKDREKIALGISKLSNNPRPHGSKKLKGSEFYRLRIGDYRVIYLIKDNRLIVVVVRIGHRREIYRQ
ncbi:MAG: type II toxin-antitoxin system RelE/ParE family toxin [Ignavibacteriaceae bacterium]|jgi:mRNA interferase RelE/StbE|nr:type II toxin-antitoxin system RelE/ParE family toxin [Ignavibacteriaceae bacterium]